MGQGPERGQASERARALSQRGDGGSPNRGVWGERRAGLSTSATPPRPSVGDRGRPPGRYPRHCQLPSHPGKVASEPEGSSSAKCLRCWLWERNQTPKANVQAADVSTAHRVSAAHGLRTGGRHSKVETAARRRSQDRRRPPGGKGSELSRH